ncbi:quinoprotein relay system zinc metallohydrolase 2 [Methylogaea oryzae]|uniref:quinoprotein relay system zinc metallohydrolase 2 n=1 Tax=Methylogaea oryzae TaxID=1295382 RepID=UPI000A4C1CE6|nr:quinoprotein relay system zinc metallohydrolase 2 [Methylogaea oryzae]
MCTSTKRASLPRRHNRDEIANIGFIVGDRAVAVIDSGGHPGQGEALKAAVHKATDKPIRYVVNTHVHPDHILGNAAFKAPGVVFVGHHKLAHAMALRAPHYLATANRDLGLALNNDAVVPPTLEVKDKLELDLGNRTLTLTAWRTAHTDNDLTVYDSKTQTLWLADLLFVEHVPTLDGSVKGWLAALDDLAKQPVKLAIPGHGPVQRDWPQALEPEKQYLLMLRDEIRGLIKQGGTLEQAIGRVGQSIRSRWPLFDQYHKRNVSAAFAELEWED